MLHLQVSTCRYLHLLLLLQIDGMLMHEHLGSYETKPRTTTLREKIVKIVDSATDTERSAP